MDLGNLLGQVLTEVISTRQADRNQARPVGFATQMQPALFDMPFADIIPEQGDSCGTGKMLWDPRANCGQGKGIKRRKRRRKRLATASDIKDLSALQGAGLTGKALASWIATH